MKKYLEVVLTKSKSIIFSKDLFKVDKNKIDEIKYTTINELIKLIQDINIREIPEKKNPKK